MPFLEHLEELRWRILWSLGALLVGVIIGFVIVQQLGVLELLIRPIEPVLEDQKLIFLGPADAFFITLKLAVVVGLLLALPVIVYHIWAFVAPALLPREKRAIVPALYFGLVLFCLGAALAYFVVLPLTLRFMMGFQSDVLEASITATAYLAFVVKLLLAFGIAFELPIVVLVLSVLGIVDAQRLAKGRRYAVVGGVILASFLTPGDILSTLLMLGPLILLYELSIGLAKMVERRRERLAAAEAAEVGAS
jgi:sec-independent protein translocase protein TatC